ncbi:MAG: hypothetical protein ACAI38_09345 [Myxococcota bacterium]
MKSWLARVAVLSSVVVACACGEDVGRAPDLTDSGDIDFAAARPSRPPPTCFAQDPAMAWMHGDTGASAPGASQKLATGFALCSDAVGMANGVDNFYWVGQGTPADFTLTATLTRLDAGQASVVFSPQQGSTVGARLRLTVAKASKGFTLTAASRSAQYAAETVLATRTMPKLPVTLSVKRVDTLLQLFADTGTGLKPIAQLDATSGELAQSGIAMLTQASGAQSNFAQAVFERILFQSAPEKTEGECTEGFVATMGEPLRIFGSDLGRVKSVAIGGQPAAIQSRADDHIVVTMPTIQDGATTVMLRTATQEHYVPAALTIARPAPTPPALSLVVDATGNRVIELREGDHAYFEGTNLPSAGAVRMWLGSSEAIIEADSTPQSLHVRVGAVSANEAGCPRFFVPSGPAADRASFGDVYSVRASFAPHLCPALVAGTATATATSTTSLPRLTQTTSRDGTVTVSVPNTLAGGEQLSVLWSATAGRTVSRGSRFIELEVPTLVLSSAQDRYRETLGALGKILEESINGGGDEELCDCEVEVTADPDAGLLVLAPCVAMPVEPEEPEPAIPGLPTDLESNKQIWSLLGLSQPYYPPPANCNDVSPYLHPRQYSWCAFLRMVLEVQGVPQFEKLVPLNRVADTNDPTPTIPEPMQRAIADKGTIVEQGLANRYVSLGYADPQSIAERMDYCGPSFDSHWMPRFKTEDRMLKLFWAVESELGGVDKTKLYTYQPPSGPRQYLVGMHIAVARYDQYAELDPTDKGYFRWITFWVPNVGNPSQRYNQQCAADLGHNDDKPDALQGTKWGEFVMCSELDGFSKCGNPWGPHNECTVNSTPGCATCHAGPTGGRLNLPNDDSFGLRLGWLFLPKYKSAQIEAHVNEFQSGQVDYPGLMLCEWSTPLAPDPPN